MPRPIVGRIGSSSFDETLVSILAIGVSRRILALARIFGIERACNELRKIWAESGRNMRRVLNRSNTACNWDAN